MKNAALTKFALCLLLVLAVASGSRAHGQSSAPNEDACVTDGPVKAIALTADRVFLGGSFRRVGAYTGGGVPLSGATGKSAMAFPRINGVVNCCVADGKGGWFVGGTFDKVGYLPRLNLAHILPTGRVDEDFQADANSTVRALALAGNTLYVGGSFTTLGGEARHHIAAINLLTGAINPAWNPDADGDVYALAAPGTLVYAGGSFKNIGGKARHLAAALSTATGAASVWDARLSEQNDGPVRALAVSGGRVYVGGDYDYHSDNYTVARSAIASFDAVTGAVTDWNPNPRVNGDVYCLSISGSTIYIGGMLSSWDGHVGEAMPFAALDMTSGDLRNLDPNPKRLYIVYSLLASGSKLFVGGDFRGAASIRGADRNYLASFDIASGAVTSWDPIPDGVVYALAASGATVFAGGGFSSINMQDRMGLAALDAATGALTSWNPGLDDLGKINHLAVGGSTLYLEGAFSSVGGQPRNCLAAVDLATGAPTAWNPPTITTRSLETDWGNIYAMAAAGGKVYVSGLFDQVGDQPRKNLVALDGATGAISGPDLAVDDFVYALKASGSTLYVGGRFTSIGGQARNYIAALDAATGAVTAWNPNANGAVTTLAVGPKTVYAGGSFTTIGGKARSTLASLDSATGAANAWNPIITPGVPGRLALSGSTLFIAGGFTTVEGVIRSNLAALDAVSVPPVVLPWRTSVEGVNTTLRVIAASDTAFYVGGSFTKTAGTRRPYFAKFDISPNPARLSLSATSLDFLKGTRYAVDVERGGAPTTRTLTLTNAGNGQLVFVEGDAATPGLTITGAHASDFKIRSVKPSTFPPLAPGESVTVTVQFAPSAAARTLGLDAMLEVKTDSPVTPDLYIPLTGDAVPVRLSGFEAE